MKIIWSERGLRVVRMITVIFLILAGLGILTAFLMIICGVGNFDYGEISSAEEKRTKIMIICGIIIAAVCTLAAIFGNKINDAINAELRRRDKIAQMKQAEIRKKQNAQLIAKRIEQEQYKILLAQYADDVQDGEGN